MPLNKMVIGIDASRAFRKERTGTEEYSYELIKRLVRLGSSHQFILYTDRKIEIGNCRRRAKAAMVTARKLGNIKIKYMPFPRLWTQIRLSWEMLINPPDVLFIPAHAMPIVRPKKTVVTIHGLEYEYFPEAYSSFERWYLKWSTRFTSRHAWKIITPSQNTKRDLIKFYGTDSDKIRAIRHGFAKSKMMVNSKQITEKSRYPYLLFIGRLEKRKNILRLIDAFCMLKQKYKIPHRLILVGKPGYGHKNSKFKIQNSKFKSDIIELGYVSQEEKFGLLKNADVFVYPSLYEGFGMPVLEAFSLGTPVVCSSASSLPEVAGNAAILVDPLDVYSIASGVWKILSDKKLNTECVQKGSIQVQKFSWDKCARETLSILEL